MRIEGKTVGYSNVSYTERVSKGGFGGLFGGKRRLLILELFHMINIHK